MDNNSWIIIPDIHGRKFWRRCVLEHENENIVFLGDYLDPYPWEEITPGDATRELRAVIDFKKQHMKNALFSCLEIMVSATSIALPGAAGTIITERHRTGLFWRIILHCSIWCMQPRFPAGRFSSHIPD